MQESPRKRAASTRAQTPALLRGLILGPTGCAMSPTHTRKGGKLYRYYVSQSVLKQGRGACPVGRLPAAEIETAVIDQLRGLLRTPEVIVATWKAGRPQNTEITEGEVRDALMELDPLWNELFPCRAGPHSSAASSSGWMSPPTASRSASGRTGLTSVAQDLRRPAAMRLGEAA